MQENLRIETLVAWLFHGKQKNIKKQIKPYKIKQQIKPYKINWSVPELCNSENELKICYGIRKKKDDCQFTENYLEKTKRHHLAVPGHSYIPRR